VQGNLAAATRLANDWKGLFPDRFYLEIQRIAVSVQKTAEEQYIQQVRVIAAQLELPVVATHPIQFTTPDDYRAHEARTCIAEGYVLADTRRPKNFTTEQYFKTQAEISTLFADMPEALANSVAIALPIAWKLRNAATSL